MGIMAKDVVLCTLVLFQLLSAGLCDQGVYVLDAGLSRRTLSNADGTNVLRSYLVRRDSLETPGTNTAAKTTSEIFLEAVIRSQSRVQRLQKRLQGLTDVEASLATSAQSPVTSGEGEYVMQISVGSPAQSYAAIVDTGSDLIWVQCLPCTKCFQQPDSVFDSSTSSTYTLAECTDTLCKALPRPTCSSQSTCTYSYSYGDGSNTQGDLAYDTITLGSTAVPNIGFGCGHNQSGTFGGVDGLVGLGRGPLSLPSQLSPAGIPEIFSYCLVSLGSKDSSPITFGAVGTQNSAVAYTPLLTNPLVETFYYVGVTSLNVGSRRLSIPASAFQIQSSGYGGTILDSGTTLTYWTSTIYNAVIAGFKAQISYPQVSGSSYGLDLCYDISRASSGNLNLPSMVVHFTNVDWTIPVSNLFILADNSGQTICLAMGNAGSSSSSFSIIGNIQQQNNLIVYDVVNRRVGFRATNCATST